MVNIEEADNINRRYLYERCQLRLRYLVPTRLLATNQVCDGLKLKSFSLVDAYSSSKLIEGNTYAKLIPILEEIHIIEWLGLFNPLL